MGLKATREAFGETLNELISEGMNIVAVDADLAGSTTLNKVASEHPDRFVDVGIAEQNMMGVAAGLSLTGRIAFTGSFAVFGTGRCYDQIRNTVVDSGLNVKICPTHAGLTVGEDGATHQMLEDIGLMRGLPGVRILVPADYWAAKAALRLAATTEGPVYVRMGRHKVPEIYDTTFTGGIPYAGVLREGTDLTLLATGVEVAPALEAADILVKQGISAEVIDVFSIAPLDEQTILKSVEKTGRVVTVEEHSVETGMGSAVANLLSEKRPCTLHRLGMHTFGTSGNGDALLEHFKLDGKGIAEQIRDYLEASEHLASGLGHWRYPER